MKKGQVTEELVRILKVVMATVVILSLIGIVFVKNLNENEDIELCRLSFFAGDALKGKGVQIKEISLQCPRRTITFDKGDVTKFGNFQEKTVLKELAEELRICNYMTNEGKTNPFEQDWFGFSTSCIICSDIRFDDDLVEKYGENELDVLSYIKNTVMPKADPPMYYLDYLKGDRGIDYTKMTGINEGAKDFYLIQDVYPRREYYVIYRYVNDAILVDGSSKEVHDPLMKNVAEGYDEGQDYSAVILIDKDDYNKLGCEYNAN